MLLLRVEAKPERVERLQQRVAAPFAMAADLEDHDLYRLGVEAVIQSAERTVAGVS
jgi:hypothetical protein